MSWCSGGTPDNSPTPVLSFGADTNTHYRIRRDRIDTTGAVSLRRAERMQNTKHRPRPRRQTRRTPHR